MFMVILAPEAGSFWSIAIENSVNHKSDATRFRFLATAFLSQAIGGDKAGDKWETSGKTHKTIVKHVFVLGRQEDTKLGKKGTCTKQK